jgi:hypothetical protein
MQLYSLRFRLVRTSFRGSSLRSRGSRQPLSSSTLSSCDTLSLLGFLHHRLSLLQRYSPVDFRVRDNRAFSLPPPAAGPSNFSVPSYTPIQTGFTPPVQLRPHLLTDTPFSTNLSASYSELTGQPTPSHTIAVTTSGMSTSETVAPLVIGTGTTEIVPSSVASTDPPIVGALQVR